MAKIGYLYLRGGLWEGKQILPASWIEGVRQANVDMRETWASELRYGSQFWVMPGRDAYFAVGYHRQLIVVMPKLDIVAVVTGARALPAAGRQAVRADLRLRRAAGLPGGRRDFRLSRCCPIPRQRPVSRNA